MKQPLLFLSFNYPQRAVYTLFTLSNLCCFINQFSSTRRLAIVYMNLQSLQPLFFIVQLSSARRLAIVYIKQPLLFVSFN